MCRLDPLAVGGLDPRGPSGPHEDAGDPARAADLAPQGTDPPCQCLRELTGATGGDRKADGLAEHAEQQAHHAGAGAVERNVGMRRVPRNQQSRGVTTEPIAPQLRGRRQQGSHETESTDGAQPGGGSESVPDRREW